MDARTHMHTHTHTPHGRLFVLAYWMVQLLVNVVLSQGMSRGCQGVKGHVLWGQRLAMGLT